MAFPRISVVVGKRGHSSFEAGHGWSAHRFDEHVLPFAFCLCWHILFLAQVKVTDWWLILVDKIFRTCIIYYYPYSSPYQILYHHWAETSETCFQLNHCYSRSLAQNWGSPPSCHSQTSSSLGTKFLATSWGLCFAVFVSSGARVQGCSRKKVIREWLQQISTEWYCT